MFGNCTLEIYQDLSEGRRAICSSKLTQESFQIIQVVVSLSQNYCALQRVEHLYALAASRGLFHRLDVHGFKSDYLPDGPQDAPKVVIEPHYHCPFDISTLA